MRALMTTLLSAALLANVSLARAEDAPEITASGVLGVKSGMTLAQARRKLRGVRWSFHSRFMVDFSADCASKGGEEILCLLVYESAARKPREKIQAIVVVSGKLRASGGVRVGMKISDVEKRWGRATFAFSHEDESREYIDFAKGPKRVLIRARLAGEKGLAGGRLGLYPKAKASETTRRTHRYNPKAVVASIWVN